MDAVAVLALLATGLGARVLADRASCPRCGGYSCDEWIAWRPEVYTCDELETDYGCDCRGCDCGPPPRPSKNAATLVMLDEAKYPDARCLDGSMSGYYLRNGTANKVLVFFEGGGWCYDARCASPSRNRTLEDCHRRAGGRLGSSRHWRSVEDSYLTGMLDADPGRNAAFHDWTLVYVPYCDGTSWSADAVVDGLHFKGKAILRALAAELVSTIKVASSDQVVVSGGSAGASAVLWQVDWLADQLRLGDGKLRALPDAGFFLDLRDKDGIDCWPNQMRSLFEVAGGYGELHAGCLERFSESKDQWKCLFPQYYADLIKTPTLLLNSLYDESEIECTLRLDCAPHACRGSERQLFQALRDGHIAAWAPLVKRAHSGVWAPGCVDHTMTWEHWDDPRWEVPAGAQENTMVKVVQRWLAGRDDDGRGFVYEDVAWPNNGACAGGRAAVGTPGGSAPSTSSENPQPIDMADKSFVVRQHRKSSAALAPAVVAVSLASQLKERPMTLGYETPLNI